MPADLSWTTYREVVEAFVQHDEGSYGIFRAPSMSAAMHVNYDSKLSSFIPWLLRCLLTDRPFSVLLHHPGHCNLGRRCAERRRKGIFVHRAHARGTPRNRYVKSAAIRQATHFDQQDVSLHWNMHWSTYLGTYRIIGIMATSTGPRRFSTRCQVTSKIFGVPCA